jgi:mono/diheme cytochrome c family protein
MHIFFIKSLLSLVLLLLLGVGMYTMFELLGRAEKRYRPEALRKAHSLSGIAFFLLSLVIAYLCLDFLLKTRAEPSPRAALHAIFSIAVLFLLCLKILFRRVYRQFYNQLQTLGFVIAFSSTVMISTSAGYYLLVTRFGKEMPAVRTSVDAVQDNSEVTAKTDPQSIAKGKALYEAKCTFCHDPFSNVMLTGPGHKGILKNPLLPVSEKPANPENVANQLRKPYKDMPSFAYLSDDEVGDLIAYLNTL